MNETKLLVLNNELTEKSEWGANIHSWTDKAKFLSTAYNNANILVDYTMIRPEYKKLEGEPRTQIYQSLVNQLNDIILDKDSKLADMITIFKQCVDVELPGMYDKETLFTNYVNFIFKICPFISIAGTEAYNHISFTILTTDRIQNIIF